jgi:hypothetical protein
MEARQSAVNAADIEPYENFSVRGGAGSSGGQIRRPARQPAPQHVSLLSRALPRPVPSAFGAPAVQAQARMQLRFLCGWNV